MSALATVPGHPRAPVHRLFRSGAGAHLLIVPHTRIYDLPDDLADALSAGSPEALAALGPLLDPSPEEIPLEQVPTDTPPQSLSLNVSSACNLSCGYCYAGRGAFGGAQPAPMTWEVARAAVDRLLAGAEPCAPVTIGFLGGEPFVNRALIHQVVGYASGRARDVRFSVTTNGTLLGDEDVAMLRAHSFAVTVSVDGGAEVHDAQRPIALGRRARSGLARLERGVGRLLAEPGLARVAARATVVSGPFDLERRFDDIVAMGFPEVGFSPVRGASPGALRDPDWPRYLAACLALAGSELARAREGTPMRLTNLVIALKQLHRGASMPYPCGAGGGYFSVAADGTWYACHRAIGQPAYALGDSEGLDAGRRADFLRARHVHAQPECATCWARYLCSGSCHQEASARSAASCDFVRAWLDFCLRAYCELSTRDPGLFGAPRGDR